MIEWHDSFCLFSPDRNRFSLHAPETGGNMNTHNRTQFGQVMRSLKVEMLSESSQEALGAFSLYRAAGLVKGKGPATATGKNSVHKAADFTL